MNPTGFQVELVHGAQRAIVVEVGGGLRRYAVDGREVLDGYAVDELCRSGRGQLLLPWPNRIRDGRYAFRGEERQLALTDPGKRNAIHGLVRFANWTLSGREEARATLAHVLHPQPGYPHALELQVTYALGADGLTVRTVARNVGATAAPFGAGAHPYLRPAGPTVDASTLQAPGATRLLTDERGIPTGTEAVEGSGYDFRAPREVGTLELDTAFTELERDAGGRARVRLDGTTLWLDEQYTHVMLFTGDPLPDVARRALAVEPMTCAPNAFADGEVRVLDPGERFEAEWGIEPG